MKRASATIVVACAMALGAGGCAHATRPVILEPPAGASVSRLSDLPSMPGAHVVVLLRSGESARGTVETIDGNVLVLRVTEDWLTTRRVTEEEIVCLARRRKIDDGSRVVGRADRRHRQSPVRHQHGWGHDDARGNCRRAHRRQHRPAEGTRPSRPEPLCRK
jgi:hypothetical protein